VRTLQVDGARWLAEGTTSLAELLRVTGAASWTLAKSPTSHLLEELRARAESVSAKRVEQQQLSGGCRARWPPPARDFSPSALDTEALDDLVNLMLGKSNQFLLCASLRGFGRW